MNRRLLVASAALAATLTTTAVQAEDTWILMGSKGVGLSTGSDIIDLSSARGSYKAVRIVAKRQRIELNNVEVVYNTGASHNERRPINLLDGERTRPIDQRNDGKFIDKINLSFKSQPAATLPSVIEVYGLQSDAGARAVRATAAPAPPPTPGPVAAAAAVVPPGPATGNISTTPTTPAPAAVKPGVPTDAGEVLFGTQSVGFAVDRDVIRVGPDVGKFDKVRLRVLDSNIFINSMKVKNIILDRKVLAELAEKHPKAFTSIVEQVK